LLRSAGSAGSTPLRILASDGGRELELFGKLYARTHLRSDRWYKLGRAILYGRLEDEVSFNSVRQLVEYEDYMLRVMSTAELPTPNPFGFVELTPEREYLLLCEFLPRAEEADEDNESEVSDDTIDDALRIVRRMWDEGIAHRDIKPSNILMKDGNVRIVDVAFAQLRPSAWRQAVDLANMMLVMALMAEADRVYERALEFFVPQEVAEAFAATGGVTIPSQLRSRLAQDGRDLVGEFRALCPRRQPIGVQRWTTRRLLLTIAVIGTVAGLAVITVVNLANPSAP